MDVLKSQFEADSEKIERQFKENQVQGGLKILLPFLSLLLQMRIETSLQDKIAARRQRRARKHLEEKELEAIKGDKKDKRHRDKKHRDKKHRDKKHRKDKHGSEERHEGEEEKIVTDDAEE